MDMMSLEIIEAEYGRDMRQIIDNALEMMYYAETLKVGNSIIPQAMVRSRMYALHCSILLYAIDKAKNNTYNTGIIKRSTNYPMNTIYNAITEYHTDVELDPYLNRNRLMSKY